jgi:predicted ArsR family transcriptional regulator
MGLLGKIWFPDLKFPRVRATDPITSFEAADQSKELASKHHKAIVEALKSGNMGKDGIAAATGLDGNQVARRLPELAKMGFIQLTGKTTRSKSGRSEREWGLNA